MFGRRTKKSMLFTIDALFGVLILVTAIFFMSNNYIIEDKYNDLSYISYDIAKSFSNIKTSELNNSYLKMLINMGVINNTNTTILECIGELYVLNRSVEAKALAENITYYLIPRQYGFGIAVNDEEVYSNNKSIEKSLVSAKRLISGIEKFKPIRGSTSKVYLDGVEEKKDTSYVFFGGFIGQGNISVFNDEIPNDAVITKIIFQAEIGDAVNDSFTIFVNDVNCINISKKSGEMFSDIFDITNCKDYVINGGRNNISISPIPSTSLDIAYISGGFFRFDYITKQMYKPSDNGYVKYYLPSIDGLINLYSSIYVPGDIINMNIQLKYLVNHTNSSNSTFYMKIGNTTVIYDSNSTTIQTISLDGSVLQSMNLNYSFLSSKNIPIRVGAENMSYVSDFRGVTDVVLIMDTASSMNWKVGEGNNGGARGCNDPDFNLSDTQRLSVGKCSDIIFSNELLNISGNLVGLISYDLATITNQTVDLTGNITKIENMINMYSASGQRCICCGINSAKEMINKSLLMTTLISSGSSWKYNNFTLKGNISNDVNGKSWYELSFDESSWHENNAILGTTNGYSYAPVVNTEIGKDLNGSRMYVDLWEHNGDIFGPPNDFNSTILNYTANTYGLSGNDDGWDWDNNSDSSGPFGFDDDLSYSTLASNKKLEFSSKTASNKNNCNNYDCSGAYGIKINITNDMYEIIRNDGNVFLGFKYGWSTSKSFDNAAQVWIKARITRPGGESFYLGRELDKQHEGKDSTNEIDTLDDPTLSFENTYRDDISEFFNSSGYYYLEIGGKLNGSTQNEYGSWYFDDIELMITNSTDHYYFRKNFTINDISKVQKGVLNVLSDDRVLIYVNENLINLDGEIHEGKIWNRAGINIDRSKFVTGQNIIAVELLNSNDAAKFDLELLGVNDSRSKNIVIMTDAVYGNQVEECSEQGTSNGINDTIKAACMASEDYGINIYAVGISDQVDSYIIENMAKCGNGIALKSSNISEILEFYKNLANSLKEAYNVEQKIIVLGTPTLSKLFGDESFIEINYTTPIMPPQIGDISVNFEDRIDENCMFNVNISPKIRVIDSKVLSYSSSKWTDFVFVNNNTIHNLSVFNEDYEFLGDPFIVSFSPTLLNPGIYDNIKVRVGTEPDNSTVCSLNSTLIYTGLMKATITYSDVLEFAEGCNWDIQFEDDSIQNMKVPREYSGLKICSFKPGNISFNVNDTYDDAVYNLLNNLDLDGDQRVDVNLLENNLLIDAISVNKVPYPWGPAIAEVRVWQ